MALAILKFSAEKLLTADMESMVVVSRNANTASTASTNSNTTTDVINITIATIVGIFVTSNNLIALLFLVICVLGPSPGKYRIVFLSSCYVILRCMVPCVHKYRMPVKNNGEK